jgi:serine/threonine protein kinase
LYSLANLTEEDNSKVNILITPSLRACLADFGLATTKDSQTFPITSAASTRAKGTLRWQAPELLDPEMDDASCANSFASDVYAYACVCYEVMYMTIPKEFCLTERQIFSGRLPFHEITNDYRMMVAVREGKRPSRPSDSRCRIRGLDNEIWTIVQACWAQDPNCRPTAHQIVQQLRSSPTRVVDERPVDHCDPSFPLRTLYSQAEHPFSALPGITNNDG